MTSNTNVPVGVHRVGFGFVWIHLLADDQDVVIVDTGLHGEAYRVERKLRELGLGWSNVRAILLTHGHLDHAGNAMQLRELTRAPVCAHPQERAHLDGTYPYQGIARICGWMEAVGRAATCYRPAPIDRELHDGQVLPWWGGLRVMHLPGHTVGHCGFYSERHDVLFAGDLFQDYLGWTMGAPTWFNSVPQHFQKSFDRVAALNPRYIVPNHYSRMDGEMMARHFRTYYQRKWAR